MTWTRDARGRAKVTVQIYKIKINFRQLRKKMFVFGDVLINIMFRIRVHEMEKKKTKLK